MQVDLWLVKKNEKTKQLEKDRESRLQTVEDSVVSQMVQAQVYENQELTAEAKREMKYNVLAQRADSADVSLTEIQNSIQSMNLDSMISITSSTDFASIVNV